MRRWEHDALLPLPKPWRNLGEAIASAPQGGRRLGHPVVRTRSGRRERAPTGRRAAGAAGPSAVRLPRAQSYPRVPARRADRRAVARGPARRGRLGAERAAVQAAARAGRGRADRARRVAPAPRGPGARRHRGLGGRDPRGRGGDGDGRPRRRGRSAPATRSPTDLQTFLPDAEGGWAAEQRRELETIRLRALETLAEAGLRQGGRELGAAEQAARSAIAAAPFRESAHRLLMEVHEAAGNPAEALRAFEELRSLLREELGTTPGPAAMAVFERVLRGEPPPVHRVATPSSAAVGPGALGAVAVAARRSRAAVDRHALVGRGVELAYLERCWREATDGQRALVLLAGDAGIGKTRGAAELAVARPRRRRGRAVRALRRGDADARTSRWSRCCAAGRRARRWTRCATGSARAPRSSRSCCRSSARRPPTTRPRARSPARRRTRSASASSTPSPRCWARSAPRRRSCWCSTTCTGPTARRCSSCATSCARPRRGACCSSAPTARARSPTATRCTS